MKMLGYATLALRGRFAYEKQATLTQPTIITITLGIAALPQSIAFPAGD
jgi:hypothetical protein